MSCRNAPFDAEEFNLLNFDQVATVEYFDQAEANISGYARVGDNINNLLGLGALSVNRGHMNEISGAFMTI